MAITFTPEDAATEVALHLDPGAVVLVKGSAVARMERVVELLLAEGSDPAELLVRQDRAWRSLSIVQLDRPTWLEIDLSAVTHNIGRLAARAPGAEVMVVLKADAYGHGAIPVAHTALRSGATSLGVACLPEARALRQAGIRAPVLVLGYTPGLAGPRGGRPGPHPGRVRPRHGACLWTGGPGPRLHGGRPRQGRHRYAPTRRGRG